MNKKKSNLKKVTNGINPTKQAELIKEQQALVEEQLIELKKLHAEKSKLPDRPRIVYVEADTLDQLTVQVEDKIDEGFMIPFNLVINTNDFGYNYVQMMMKR